MFIIGLGSLNTSDHDSSAGYDGRIGFRYKTSVMVYLPAKQWSKLKKTKNIGSLVVDVANAVYRSTGFKQTYSPQVDTKVRAKKGIVSIQFDYFHNSNEDVLKTEYNQERGFLKHHVRAAEKLNIEYNPSQWSLDSNNNIE